MIYQVGNPEMFEGNRFFPLTLTPMSAMVWSRIKLALCEPVPFAVAMLRVKSLTTVSISFPSFEASRPCSCRIGAVIRLFNVWVYRPVRAEE